MKEKTGYQRKLAHPKWQMKRLEIMKRDGASCQHCGSVDKELHVHHKYYESGKLPHEYPDESLISLCYECHSLEEESLKLSSANIVMELRQMGFSGYHFETLSNLIRPLKCDSDYVLNLLDIIFYVVSLDNEDMQKVCMFIEGNLKPKSLKIKNV